MSVRIINNSSSWHNQRADTVLSLMVNCRNTVVLLTAYRSAFVYISYIFFVLSTYIIMYDRFMKTPFVLSIFRRNIVLPEYVVNFAIVKKSEVCAYSAQQI